MSLVDSHCHLDIEDFADRDEVIARARAAGVEQMIVVGSGRDVSSARQAFALADQHDFLFAAVGIHPHDVKSLSDETFSEIASLAKRQNVVAVGETGLDYFYDHSPRDEQVNAFRRFIRLGREVDKPIVVHVRDAHEDARRILDEEGAGQVGTIIHCFTGTQDDADAYLAAGYHISFSGIVTFKNAQPLRDVVARVPDDRLLIETDCPFLAPVPMRGKRNEPAYLVHTAEVIAKTRGTTAEDASAKAAEATRRAFRLP